MKTKIFLIVLIALVLGVVIGSNLFIKVTPSEYTVEEFSKGSYSGSHYGRTQDGVLCDIKYNWYINHSISEDEHLKIDLVIKRTIAKSFSYYKYEQITKIPDDFTVDLKSRIEDAVFAIEPSGFVMTNVFITMKPTF